MTDALIGAIIATAFLAFIFLIRKVYTMSASLDALTASVAALETVQSGTITTAVNAALAEIASLNAGTDTAALDALKGRVDTVASNLTSQAAALTTAATTPA